MKAIARVAKRLNVALRSWSAVNDRAVLES
jgi:hypothetical protein